ncbi:TetR/AcrR family transcriptional regulator [uncultured Tateyamaria sp.]|uniref:TetR/AcrR family transcriptional regulator n=1 Tax=uncultured Tateyamaria sp. TaxID=455651 RepID=UPI002608FCCA|nr:TetR/AcrR family transcriptional regulator [uncultured Tateyamaria sp.]
MPTQATRAPQQDRSQKRVEQILDAARNVIVSKGQAQMTMSEIARTAGISMSSIYQYFPDKTAIIAALCKHYLDQNRATMEAALTPPPANTAALLDRCLQMMQSYFDMHRREPMLRHLWSSFTTDPALRAIDAQDSEDNIDLIFAQSAHLFDPSVHPVVRHRVQVLFQMSISAVEFALQHEDEVARAIVAEAQDVLRAAWSDRIETIGKA